MKQQAMTQAHVKSISKIYGDSPQLRGDEQSGLANTALIVG